MRIYFEHANLASNKFAVDSNAQFLNTIYKESLQ